MTTAESYSRAVFAQHRVWRPESRSPTLGGQAVVEAEQAAKPLARLDRI